MKLQAIALSALITSGCATIIDDNKESVYIGAYSPNGDPVSANCIVTNDEGTVRTRSNRHVTLGKDKDEIKVKCQNDEYFGETVNSSASVNAGYLAADFFLIDLCLVSCWIDGLSGSWVNMPSNIDVAMDPK